MRELPPKIAELAACMPPMAKNAVTVLEKRYLDRDNEGNLTETVDGLFWRVASTLAENGRQYGMTDEQITIRATEYFLAMRHGDGLPNSPTLANAGTRTGQLSACFVLPIEDAFSNKQDGIYDTLTKSQLIQQTGGGVGYAFSRLREKDALVETTKGLASGPVSFMEVFDVAVHAMKQGGMRRGAQMGILSCDHPDILVFISYKGDLTKLTNFNVSVAITDAFLKALAEDGEYELVSPKSGPTGKFLKAREVWAAIIQRAHATGEPGVVFIDRMNAHNPNPGLGRYEATNPCGEQALIPYESCNLASIAVDQFVRTVEGQPVIDWARLEEVTRIFIRMMDDVVDVNLYVPGVPEIRETTLKTRKLGLGVMGAARMLFKLGLGYDTDEGRRALAEVYAFIDLVSKEESMTLAKVRGAFPYMKENWSEVAAFYFRDWDERINTAQDMGFHWIAQRYDNLISLVGAHGMRNSTTTTVAPTGTISIIADTSGGCEPVFALAMVRNQADTLMYDTDPVFEAALRERFPDAEKVQLILNTVATYKGSLKRSLQDGHKGGFKLVTQEDTATLQELAKVFVTAGDTAPEDHVRMQAAMQQYCDSAISKTVNFPREATVEDVERAYNLAVELGCKGVTIYRDESRNHQPLTAGDGKKKKAEPDLAQIEQVISNASPAHPPGEPRPRPERLYGFTETIQTGDGKMYATVNYDEQGVREVVAEIGRSGGTLNSLTEAIGRLISLALQYGIPVQEIIHKLIGIRSANVYGFGPKQVLSIPDAIAKLLKRSPDQFGIWAVVGVGKAEEAKVPQVAVTVGADERLDALALGESPECPSCGSAMKFGEGCKGGTCTNPECGYAKC